MCRRLRWRDRRRFLSCDWAWVMVGLLLTAPRTSRDNNESSLLTVKRVEVTMPSRMHFFGYSPSCFSPKARQKGHMLLNRMNTAHNIEATMQQERGHNRSLILKSVPNNTANEILKAPTNVKVTVVCTICLNSLRVTFCSLAAVLLKIHTLYNMAIWEMRATITASTIIKSLITLPLMRVSRTSVYSCGQ